MILSLIAAASENNVILRQAQGDVLLFLVW